MGHAHDVGSGRDAHPWADALGELHGRDQVVEIRMRHEPAPWQRALIERLGGRIVIDPRAPACCPDCKGGEMTTTTAPPVLECARCDHPFRQHVFAGACTLHSCSCEKFVPKDSVGAANGNGHQAGDDARAALDRMDRGEPQLPEPAAAPTGRGTIANPKPKSTTCKRCDKPVRPGAPVKGPYALLCDEHYDEVRGEFSRRALERNGHKTAGGTTAEPRKRAAAATTSPARAPLPAIAAEPQPEPETAPPPAVAPPSDWQITSLSVRLGPSELYRDEEGTDCKLYRGNGEVIESLAWDELEQLPALIQAVGQAFGAADE